jgi:hypothetical protein
MWFNAFDHSGTNINRMEGVRRLAGALSSRVEIEDVDLDGGWTPSREYGLALFLGTLYHLNEPVPCPGTGWGIGL